MLAAERIAERFRKGNNSQLAITNRQLHHLALLSKRGNELRNMSDNWKIYRTRFLVKAQQITRPCMFVDALGREHRGRPGDYLVESSDGSRRIAPQMIFEDIYVPMDSVEQIRNLRSRRRPTENIFKRRLTSRPLASA
jgi:hypothetical protein